MCLRASGYRPRRLATGCLSKLSDSGVDGGIICTWYRDALQQIVEYEGFSRLLDHGLG